MSDKARMRKSLTQKLREYRESFAGKLYISFMVIAIALSLTFFAVDFWQESRVMNQNVENKGRLLSAILAYHARIGVFSENRDRLKASVEGVIRSKDISFVRFFDVQDRLIYEHATGETAPEGFGRLPGMKEVRMMKGGNEDMQPVTGRENIVFTMPVVIERLSYDEGLLSGDDGTTAQQQIIGYVQVAIAKAYHEKKVARIILADIAISAFFLLIGGSIVFLFIRKSTRPLAVLTEAVRSFGKESIQINVPVQSGDEVGKLSHAFNEMSETLVRKEGERQRLETQFRQAQKMEAVGTMAGGIAHDFKNILTAISGFSNLAKMSLEKNDPAREYVEHILTASSRAAALVQSLLAFSRQQLISPKAVDLNTILTNVEKMLRRLIREDIRLDIQLSKERSVVMADAGQIDQVLMNLCTNARDSMPDGGTLSIAIGKTQLDKDFFPAFEVMKPGTYATISVADTGTGMDDETRKKIFEPFFTTKEVGRGSGLGLASVYGIVKQHEGYIDVRSRPGQGTEFFIYLPLVHVDDQYEPDRTATALQRGSETILVAEDDEDVRLYVHDILRLYGYTVVEASDGDEAVQMFARHPKIDLLLLDVVMPGKNGREVLETIRAQSPQIRALFLSGYSEDIISKRGVLDEGINFISKPVSPEELLIRVREVLDSGTQGSSKRA
ncbi:MAG: response regulator [Nitrospirae bacterium]|nr:response regulator [Nitrospirota bacterium]